MNRESSYIFVTGWEKNPIFQPCAATNFEDGINRRLLIFQVRNPYHTIHIPRKYRNRVLVINHNYWNISTSQAASDRKSRMLSTDDNGTDFPVVAHLPTATKADGRPVDSIDVIEVSPDV